MHLSITSPAQRHRRRYPPPPRRHPLALSPQRLQPALQPQHLPQPRPPRPRRARPLPLVVLQLLTRPSTQHQPREHGQVKLVANRANECMERGVASWRLVLPAVSSPGRRGSVAGCGQTCPYAL